MAFTTETTTFYYDDEQQTLAQSLFQFHKKSETYAVEQMGIEGLTNNNKDIMEFFVEATTETQYRRRKSDKFSNLEEFFKNNNILAKSLPHWQRTAVTVTVYIQLRDGSGPRNDLVTFRTWYDNKYKSNSDAIAKQAVAPDYDETAAQVEAEWSNAVVSDDIVDRQALINGVGIMTGLSKHLEKQHNQQQQKLFSLLKKVKV